MNWRATIAAGLIFVALLAFVWVESTHKVAEEGQVFRESFMGLNLYGIAPEQVTKLAIQRADEDDVVIEKRGDDWFVVRPFEGLADGEDVMRMVREVAELAPKASREGVDLADEQFGLADADLVATITYNGGRTATLKVGKETPSGTERYAQVSSSDRLYVVGASTRTTLWKDPQSIREKDVAAIETDDVQRVTLDHGDEHVVAVHTSAQSDDAPKWRLIEPLNTAADEWNVKQLINKVGDLRAEGFLTPEEAQEAETGFKEPQATLTLEMNEGEPLTITFGNTETREVGDPAEETEIIYVRTSRRNEVLVVEADVLDSVQKTAFDLRDRSVVSFKRDDVTRVKVERAKGLNFTIARRPGGWFVEKPKNFEARQGAVDDILWNLEDLSATEFVTDTADEGQLREYGLAVPQVAITIELRDTEPLKVLIGEDTGEGDYYAMVAGSDQVVTISEFLMGDLPEQIEDLQKTSIEAPETDFLGDEDPGAEPAPDDGAPAEDEE